MKDKYLRERKKREPVRRVAEKMFDLSSGGADQRQTDYASHFVILSRSLIDFCQSGHVERMKDERLGKRETFRLLLGRQYQKECNARIPHFCVCF